MADSTYNLSLTAEVIDDILVWLNNNYNTIIRQGDLVGATGTSTTSAMTQKAITDALGGKADVFWATYGSTTAGNIYTAFSAGKLVLLKYDGLLFICLQSSVSASYFISPGSNGTIHYVLCNSSSQWSSGDTACETTSNKVTSLSDSSTDTEYPSAKAVYDELADKQDVTKLEWSSSLGADYLILAGVDSKSYRIDMAWYALSVNNRSGSILVNPNDSESTCNATYYGDDMDASDGAPFSSLGMYGDSSGNFYLILAIDSNNDSEYFSIYSLDGNEVSASFISDISEYTLLSAAEITDISSSLADKQDKDTDAVEGNLAEFDGNGNTIDAGIAADDIVVREGIYPTLAAGAITKVMASQEFINRATAGGAGIVDGVQQLKAIYGNSQQWNQLVDTDTESVTIPSGHKYYSVIDSTAAIGTSDGTAIAVTGGTDMLFDLTAMGIDDLTTAEVEAWLAEHIGSNDYYDYNAGTILNNVTTGIKTTGFNQWDEEVELGTISSSTGEEVASTTSIRSKNYIEYIPTEEYYCRVSDNTFSNGYMYFGVYDANMNFIGAMKFNSANGFSSRKLSTYSNFSKGKYLRIWWSAGYGVTYLNDTCINISSSRNGEYEAYVAPSTLTLDLTSITSGGVQICADGMMSAGQSSSAPRQKLIVDADGWARRLYSPVGSVDLGDLEWRYSSSSTRFYATLPSDAATYIGYTGSNENYLLGRYNKTIALSEIVDGCYSLANNSYIYIMDSNYTTAAAFQTAMESAGLKLIYELATPVTYTLDTPIYCGFTAYNGGTEVQVPANGSTPTTAAFYADVIYRVAASSVITEGSLTNLLNALKSAGKITSYTLNFDSASGDYEVTIS